MSDLDNYKCPECHKTSAKSRWEIGSVECEVCGDHTALICPECREYIDMAYANIDDFPRWQDLYDRVR